MLAYPVEGHVKMVPRLLSSVSMTGLSGIHGTKARTMETLLLLF